MSALETLAAAAAGDRRAPARNSPADCFPTIDDWDKPLMDNA